MSALGTLVSGLVDDFSAQRPIRTGSMVMTVLGDAISPRGGALWLSSLITLLGCFGLKERLVRTAAGRLAANDWVRSEPVGRKSVYRITASAQRRLDEATERIYTPPHPHWDGRWRLVLIGALEGRQRERLRRELMHLGFGSFSSDCLAHPTLDVQLLEQHFADNPLWASALMLTGEIDHHRQHQTLQTLVRKTWNLDALNARYIRFLHSFRPVYQALSKTRNVTPQLGFQIRTLLIHEHRKNALRDPRLPEALLPDDWQGYAAYQLCRNLYARVASAAERFLDQTVQSYDGPLPPPAPAFYERFGGVLTTPSRMPNQ